MLYYFQERVKIMVNIKIERINHMIREEISKILMLEVKDEDIKFVTVTDCDTSSDLSYCKVYVTVLDQEKKGETLKALNNASSFIRSELAKRIEIRHIPELKFFYDESISYGEHIDKLIDKINEGEHEL